MAMHFEAAGNWEQAARTLRAAARHAHQIRAYRQSAELLERASHIAVNIADADCSALVREIEDELEMLREITAGTAAQQKAS
jgi:hypothetical protein